MNKFQIEGTKILNSLKKELKDKGFTLISLNHSEFIQVYVVVSNDDSNKFMIEFTNIDQIIQFKETTLNSF